VATSILMAILLFKALRAISKALKRVVELAMVSVKSFVNKGEGVYEF
jgi:hypothetical protein